MPSIRVWGRRSLIGLAQNCPPEMGNDKVKMVLFKDTHTQAIKIGELDRFGTWNGKGSQHRFNLGNIGRLFISEYFCSSSAST